MKNLNAFEGLSFNENLVRAEEYEKNLQTALFLSDSLTRDFRARRDPLINSALLSAILTTNILMTNSQLQCTLAHPPEPIKSELDSSGNIVLRCFHTPSHEWDLSGTKK